MDFGLTDEQRALDASVRDYLTDRFDLAAVRKVYEDPSGDGHPRELWSAFAEYGWLAVTVPEQHDGLGLGILDAQVVARALGAGVVPGPWLPTVLATEAAKSAKSYLDHEPFSRDGLIKQLSSSFGEGFTYDQAVFGVNAAGL